MPAFPKAELFEKWFWGMSHSIRFYLGLDLDFWKYCNSFNSQSKQKVLGDMVLSDPALSLFKLLEYLPFNPYIAGIVVVICFVLFLTPVGSGTLMIANLSSKGGTSDSDSPIWLRIFWSVVITIVSIGLLLAGSFNSMQSAVVLCGLPFSVIILLYMFGLAKALKQDDFDPNVAKKQLAISKDISIPSNCDQNKVTEVL